MRTVNLYHGDPTEITELSANCELMVMIERGAAEGAPDFQISELGLGPTIVYVGGVVVRPSLAHAWIICQARSRDNFYVGLGSRRDYLEGIYYGVPNASEPIVCLLWMRPRPFLNY